MSEYPGELKYAESHEWARVEDDGTVTVGISDHAQDSLGDVVYVELPEIGTDVSAKGEAGVVESVKAASDVYAPISGKIISVNETLEDAPETVNDSPYKQGWFFRLQPADLTELESMLDANAYQALCDSEEH